MEAGWRDVRVLMVDGDVQAARDLGRRLASLGYQVAGLCGLSTEITDFKKAELGLRQELAETQLFRSILDESPAYVYVKDRRRRCLYANRHGRGPASPDSRAGPLPLRAGC